MTTNLTAPRGPVYDGAAARAAYAATAHHDPEATEDFFARLLEVLGAAGQLGVDLDVRFHRPVPATLMDCLAVAIDAPGLRRTGTLHQAIGHSGTATVSVTAEVVR